MRDPKTISTAERAGLHRAAVDLHVEYEGMFGTETIEGLLVSTAEYFAARSTVSNQFRMVLFVRLAREQLQALAKSRELVGKGLPGVLFLCVHNAGRSQMALGWFRALAGLRAFAWSGGSQPVDSLNDAAVRAMAEVGVDITDSFSKPWTEEVLGAADVVVTMGCGDACPLVPGKRYEDWDVTDPDAKPIDEVRIIRDQIGTRVIQLLRELGIEPDLGAVGDWRPNAATPA